MTLDNHRPRTYRLDEPCMHPNEPPAWFLWSMIIFAVILVVFLWLVLFTVTAEASWGIMCVPAVVGQTKYTGDQPATVIFTIYPANALLEINDYKVQSTGSPRQCVTPSIGHGDTKLLDVRLSWPDKGKEAAFELYVEGGNTYRVEVVAGDDKPVTCIINGKPLLYVAQANTVDQNFGIDVLRLNGTEERYTINGQQVGRTAAIEAARGGQIPDDALLPFLTIIGSKTDRQAAEKDLVGGPLDELRRMFRFQAYDPSDPMLKDRDGRPMFKTDGSPTIYFQRRDGKVLGRLDSYPGVVGMEIAMRESLRRADPNYDPAKDPDLTKPPAPKPVVPTPDAPSDFSIRPEWLMGIFIVLALAGLYYMKRRG